jgi:hypothetical protein
VYLRVVDLWPSRLCGYGWTTVAYFNTKLREIRSASVQVVGRDTHTTCIIVIMWVNILVLSKESEPGANLTFPVLRSSYLRNNSVVTTLYHTEVVNQMIVLWISVPSGLPTFLRNVEQLHDEKTKRRPSFEVSACIYFP